jgi:hypothetical protein
MEDQAPGHASLKQRAIEELQAFWLIALYLIVFLSAFTFYRRMVLAEFGVTYLHYGIAVFEALIIAKVVLLGRMLGLDKRVDRGPVMLSVIVKAVIFAVLVLLFGVLEHTVEGLLHHKDWASIGRSLLDGGVHELVARMIVLFISFVPFFAFWEIGRVLGREQLIALFFAKRRPPVPRA